MAKKYKVIVIKVLLKNNELASSGDVVDGDKFIDLEQSLKGGYVEEVSDSKEEVEEIEEVKENPLLKMTKTELKEYATSKDLAVNLDSKKSELLAEIIEKDSE